MPNGAVEKQDAVLDLRKMQKFQSFACCIWKISQIVMSFPDFALEKKDFAHEFIEPQTTLRSALHQVLSAALDCTSGADNSLLTTLLALRDLPDNVVALTELTEDSEEAKIVLNQINVTATNCNAGVEGMNQAFGKLLAICAELCNYLEEAKQQRPDSMKLEKSVKELKREKNKLETRLSKLRKEIQENDSKKKKLEDPPSQWDNFREEIPSNIRFCDWLRTQEDKKAILEKTREENEAEIKKIEGESLPKVTEKLAEAQAERAKKMEHEAIVSVIALLETGIKKLKETKELWMEIQKMAVHETGMRNTNAVAPGSTSNMNTAAHSFIWMVIQMESLSKIYRNYVEKHVEPLLFDSKRILIGANPTEMRKDQLEELGRDIATAQAEAHSLNSRKLAEYGKRLGISHKPYRPAVCETTNSSSVRPISRVFFPISFASMVFRFLFPYLLLPVRKFIEIMGKRMF